MRERRGDDVTFEEEEEAARSGALARRVEANKCVAIFHLDRLLALKTTLREHDVTLALALAAPRHELQVVLTGASRVDRQCEVVDGDAEVLVALGGKRPLAVQVAVVVGALAVARTRDEAAIEERL